MKLNYLNLKIIATLLITLMLVSCSGPITYKFNNKTIELSEDDPFQIVLEGNSNSEYHWELISKNNYVKLLKPVTLSTETDKTTYTFDFKTLSDGKQIIKFIYTDGEIIEDEFTVTIIVGTIGLITAD
ncbi:protease inhibitor I42 family protein [uncultured Winogradskyella sp.]|uniref:protease inhibitor I42 family protein n=1 Tax=uncultured Winogradskyella sp. TaxID=395353 RepID=UPI0030EB4326|tara:strand:- start:2170 stop:2553 length:384 start_codon:yes stop_codon:yes gene_type:complete